MWLLGLHQEDAADSGGGSGLGGAAKVRSLTVAKNRDGHLDSYFDDFLREEGLYEEVTSIAWKRVLAWQVSEAMKLDSGWGCWR